MIFFDSVYVPTVMHPLLSIYASILKEVLLRDQPLANLLYNPTRSGQCICNPF